MKDLWVDKYAPKKVGDYISTPSFKNKMEKWIKDGATPHLLLHGPSGTGKTAAALVLLNELEVHSHDRMIINASNADQGGVKSIRERIEDFCGTVPFGKMKYVLMDEADQLSLPAQGLLRNIIEANQSHCRFILTANYFHRIQPALKSRCFVQNIDRMEKGDFAEHVAKILIDEGVEFSIDDAGHYIDAYYPDMRACLNALQNNTSKENKLTVPVDSNDQGTDDWRLSAIALFKKNDYLAARKMICSQIGTNDEDIENFFKLLYSNVDLWADNDINKQREVIIAIRNGLANVPNVADQEINISATLCELELIKHNEG